MILCIQVYRRLVTAVNDIEKRVPFSHHDRFGFLTFCPTNLGTTVRASVHIKVPKLAANKEKLEEVASKYNLQVSILTRLLCPTMFLAKIKESSFPSFLCKIFLNIYLFASTSFLRSICVITDFYHLKRYPELLPFENTPIFSKH